MKLFSRTDPESEACGDLGFYSPLLAANIRESFHFNT